MWGRQDLRSRKDLLRTFKWKRRVLQELAFRDPDTLDRFIPHSSGTLLDELVPLETDVKNFGTLNT